MKKTTLIVLCLQLSLFTLFGQNVTGKWYEIENPNASLEITINKNNDVFSGSFTWEWKSWINTVNAPLGNLTFKNDSLLFELTHGNFKPNFKLQKNNKKNTYHGFFYVDGRQIRPVTLSRSPIERDMTTSSIVEKKYPIIKILLTDIGTKKGCYFSRMSGSGSVCYGLFNNESNAKKALDKIKTKHPKFWFSIAKTV